MRPASIPARLAVALAVGVAAVAAAPEGSSAASIAQKRKEAARLSERIESLGDRLSLLQEDYNDGRVRLESLEQRLARAQAQERTAQSRLTQLRSRSSQRAISAFTTPLDPGAVLAIDGAFDHETRQMYVDALNGTDSGLIDALDAAHHDLARERAGVEQARRDTEATTRLLKGKQRESEQLLTELQGLLARTEGELGRLVAEEQRRQAEAEARRAKDELARRRAAAQRELQRREAEQARLAREAAALAERDRRSGIRESAEAARAARAAAAVRERQRELAITADQPSAVAAVAVPPGVRSAIVAAQAQLGKPYRWGGSGPANFDCSGLTSWAWRAAGKSLPHSSRAQFASTTRVPVSAIQPGDLVFFGRPIHHVGMYIGNGMMIEAPRSGLNVRIRPYLRRDLVGVGRVR